MVASGGLYLGLESSCDDSAAAIVQVLPDHKAKVLSSIVMGQSVLHRKFGGVVPEVAARAHQLLLARLHVRLGHRAAVRDGSLHGGALALDAADDRAQQTTGRGAGGRVVGARRAAGRGRE